MIYQTNNAVVIDRAAFNKLSNSEAAAKIAELIANKPQLSVPNIMFIDNIRSFQSLPEILKAMDTQDPTLVVRLELNNVFLPSESFDVITLYHALRDSLSEKLKPVLPPYVFADVPEGWSVESKLVLSAQSIARKSNKYSTIGYKALETVWNHASKAWANDNTPGYIGSVKAQGRSRCVSIQSTSVKVGCEAIQRYELEQLALHLGWTFPQAC